MLAEGNHAASSHSAKRRPESSIAASASITVSLPLTETGHMNNDLRRPPNSKISPQHDTRHSLATILQDFSCSVCTLIARRDISGFTAGCWPARSRMHARRKARQIGLSEDVSTSQPLADIQTLRGPLDRSQRQAKQTCCIAGRDKRHGRPC